MWKFICFEKKLSTRISRRRTDSFSFCWSSKAFLGDICVMTALSFIDAKFILDLFLHSRHLLVTNKQWKHLKNVWNQIKLIINLPKRRHWRRTCWIWTDFKYYFVAFIVYFEQVNVGLIFQKCRYSLSTK